MPTTSTRKDEVATRNDTADYSATKAPENREHVESTAPVQDFRQKPGGAHGTPAEVGMSGLHRRDVPSMITGDDEVDESASPTGGPHGSVGD
jgi:hypothetical protein